MRAATVITILTVLASCTPGAPEAHDDAGTAEGETDAGPPMECDTPGATERIVCGNCGTAERFCSADRVWEVGPCTAQGECSPGTTGPVPCGMCGVRQAHCSASCEWTSGTCEDEGECEPGTSHTTGDGCAAGETRVMDCDASCGWVERTACAAMPIDVTFLVDATGSNYDEYLAALSSIRSRFIDPMLATSNLHLGVSYMAEFAALPYGDVGCHPFEGGIEPTDSGDAVELELLSNDSCGGGDGSDSLVEALSVLAGGPVHTDSVALGCSAGLVSGGCWRPDARRVIVVFSDSTIHNGPDPDTSEEVLFDPYEGTLGAARWPDVRTRLRDQNITVIFLNSEIPRGYATAQFREILDDLEQPESDEINAALDFPAACDAAVERVRGLITTPFH